MLSKMPRISAGAGRRESASSRLAYQVTAMRQSWSRRTEGRRGVFLSWHQASILSSDRKKSIVLQVKTMSAHHFAAGTATWKSQDEGSGPSSPTFSVKGSRDCSQRERISPGRFIAAGIPRASQAQLA